MTTFNAFALSIVGIAVFGIFISSQLDGLGTGRDYRKADMAESRLKRAGQKDKVDLAAERGRRTMVEITNDVTLINAALDSVGMEPFDRYTKDAQVDIKLMCRFLFYDGRIEPLAIYAKSGRAVQK